MTNIHVATSLDCEDVCEIPYGKFGFNVDAASGYSPAYELQYLFGWQAIILNKVVLTESTVKILCVASLNSPELW